MTPLGHAIRHAVQRARLDPAEVEDVIAAERPRRETRRAAALPAGLPVTTSGMTLPAALCRRSNSLLLAGHTRAQDGERG